MNSIQYFETMDKGFRAGALAPEDLDLAGGATARQGAVEKARALVGEVDDRYAAQAAAAVRATGTLRDTEAGALSWSSVQQEVTRHAEGIWTLRQVGPALDLVAEALQPFLRKAGVA